ncbi:MAG: hypothetical protein HRT87_10720, partial [Legionellales bacterium]|nr:hypothetical protein [Legionellales bacterium]
MDSFSNAKNDILSGLSTSIIALPTVIGLGVFIFSPLGHEFASIGSTVGLI